MSTKKIKSFVHSFMAFTAFIAVFATYQSKAQTTISPTTWGGTNTTTAAGPSNFSPLPASTSPGAAAVAVSQWNRGPGISYNAGANRYNSTSWSVGAVGITTAFANGDYLTFTVTNNATTQLRITGVNIGLGAASGTGPNTFGLMYRIGTGSLITFTASTGGPSPSFTGTAFTLCAGQTVTFYMPGWGGSATGGTYSINTNPTLSAQFITAISATAGSTSPVPAGTPLTFSSTVTGGVTPYTYSWSGPLSYTDATAAPVIAAPSVGASGTYSLTVTDAWGCAVQTTTPVTITPGVSCSGTPSAGTASSSTAAACGSGTSTISLSGATVASDLTYQWYEASAITGPYTLISGATSPTYNTPVVSATTYYHCQLTCTTSGFSDISTPATFTINPLPVITGTGGDVCAGGSGLSITAGGATTYSWAPATGLSATAGATVTANPTVNTTYTITGTDAASCVGTHTVTVNYNLVPSALTIAPSPVSACVGGAPVLVTATGGTAGPTTINSGSITIPASIAAFGTISRSLEMAGIPAGAVITGASVNVISFGSQYQDDYVVNITAPNGNRLNLINQRGSHTATVTTLFANTNLSSAGGPSLSTGSGTFTGTWAADAAAGVGAAPFIANTTNWTSLYSIPNGTWTLSIFNNTAFTNVVVPTAQWSITLNYTYQAPVTWSPATDLYTDATATTPYSGGATNSVYFNPATIASSTYTATASIGSCTSTATVVTTVNPLPATITGTTDVCVGFTTTLSNTTTGGTWSTASANASVDAATGVVTGISAGTADISYILPTGCFVITTVTVNAIPPAILGTLSVCVGSTQTLTNTVTGGTWASSNTNATIDATTGVATGVTTGTSVITYTAPTGCYITDVLTINPLPADITGTTSVCESGSTTALASATTGGTWTSSNANATIDAVSGVATGITAGTSIITYTIATGCADTAVLTIQPLPAAISGSLGVCVGSNTALSSATTGGTWASSTTTVATISPSGLATGLAAGTTVITYTGINTCITTAVATVHPLPAAITGPTSVCVAASIALSNSTTGGTWASSNANATIDAATGVATGATAGTATITYALGTGCIAIAIITVDPVPATITGTAQVCEGASTALSTTPTGGVWTTSSIHVAVGAATGTVAGLSAGTAVVTYTLPTSCAATTIVTVNPQPTAISGVSAVCVGASISQSSSPAGGVWSASNANVSIDAATGIVTGITTGTSVITYTVAGICFSVKTITVNPLPAAIAGPSGVCLGSNITLTSATTGGTWSASNVIVAVGSATGVVTGSSAGTSVITYTIPSGCYTTSVVAVNSLPGAITGSTGVCAGRTTSLSSSPAGGTWSSSSVNVTVDATTGVVSGVTVGTADITYTLSTGCVQSVVVTVNLLPAAIGGSLQICEGYTSLLTNTTGGGTWSSSNLATVNIDAAGLATGISVGTATITYALGTGCIVEAEVTVNPVPLATTGTLTVCQGNATVLSNPTTGGTWSSADVTVATVDASGIVTGVSGGSATISYILPTGCFALATVTVDPIPAAITGGTAVCAGFATTLFSSPTGGTWSSTDTSIARVNSTTGVLSGIVAGNTTITYTLPTGCSIATVATVNPLPPVITGTATVCEAGTTILANGVAGGTWSSANPALATVNPITGLVNGVAAGTVSISYTIPTGCFNTRIVTVNPLPSPITGTTVICQGRTATLVSSPAGGFWNSGATAVATVVSATGIVTGITAGTAEITYTLPTSCLTRRVVTVNAGPSPIVGNPNVCLGSTVTFSDTVLGGVWSSTTPAVATVGTSGVVTGFTLGTSTISYTLPVTGCYSSVVVTVQPLPNVYTVTGGGTYCAGGAGVTIGMSMSEPGVTYSLMYGSSATAFVSGTGSPISFGLHTAAGVYTVQATNGITACRRNMTGSATVVIQPLLTPSVGISTAPSDTLCAGESVLLTPTPVLGGSAPVYEWSVNGTYIATGPTYTFIPANGDIVSVGMTSNAACLLTDTAVGSRTLSVFVPAMPVVTSIVSPSDTSCEFSPVNFTATALNGGFAPVYKWLVNGVNTSSGPVFSYVPVDADVVVCKLYSNYRCRLADSVLSTPVNLTVLPIPSPAVTITSSPSLALVPGQSFTLTATVTDAGTAPVYQWLKNSVPIVGATNATYTGEAVIGVTEYICRVTSSGFCGGLTSFNLVYINGAPSNSVTPVALAQSMRLSPNPNNGTFTLSGYTGAIGTEDMHVTITNMLGQVVHKQNLTITNGNVNANITLTNTLANGMYLLNMSTGTHTGTIHFTVGK